MNKFNPNIIQVGISSCLLGEKVRFDGGHKSSAFCIHEMTKHVEFVSICPEMAIGMGTPRPAIRLVKQDQDILVQTRDGRLDVTQDLNTFSHTKARELDYLSGYIVCQKSPSCGMERVLEYSAKGGSPTKSGTGVFTRHLMQQHPHLPVEEDGRTHDLILRENFFTRLFAYHSWQCLRHEPVTKKALIAFHSRYKYLIMSHSPVLYKKLGQLTALIEDIDATCDAYLALFMEALAQKPTKKTHTNTLQHILGYFKKHLTKAQKEELSETIMKYRQGLVPLLVPLTLIKHYLLEFPIPYIENQVYLNPYPEQLKLRYAY
tara:strand:+ start:2723 stop:3676 length:954 start_codon:yes stop_codon:yes gene_type:complete